MSDLVHRFPAITGTVVARFGVLVTGLAASVITARALGPEGRGQYYAIMTLAAIAAQLGNLGLSSSNTYLAARDPESSWPLVVNGLWLAVALALVALLAIALAGPAVALSLRVPAHMLWGVCAIAPAMLAFTLASSVLVANERFAALNYWQVANAVIATGLLAGCAFFSSSVSVFVAATAVAAIVTSIGITFHLVGRQQRSLRFNSDLFRRGVSFAARAYLALLLGFLLQRAGVTLLAVFRDPREIGFFSIAAQIYDVLIIVPTTVGMVLFPLLIKQGTGTWQTTRHALFATVGVMSIACTVVVAAGQPVINLLFGEAFAPSYEVLLWLLPGVILISGTTVLSQYLVSTGFPGALVAVWLVGFIASGVAGVPLTRTYGASGAAMAQSIGIAIVCAGVAYLATRRVGNAIVQAEVT